MELKGSRTEANLWAAFAGESQARNRYTFRLCAASYLYQKQHFARCNHLLRDAFDARIFVDDVLF